MNPSDRAIRERLEDVAELLGDVCPPGVGFALMMFTYEPGWMHYASNSNREDMIKALQTLIRQLRAGLQ